MKKTKAQLFLFLLFGMGMTFVHGQIQGKIMGINGEPVPFANVLLYQAVDTTLVTGTITDDDGNFSLLPEKEGDFLVRISNLGYADRYEGPILMSTASDKHNLGTLVLNEAFNELDEVVLAAKKNIIQRTLEGQVINVQSSVMTKGSNALQVLERLPGVILDRRNNQFALNGQSGVTVMFNGRRMPLSMEDVMALLESTLADNIEKVELITSPTAKYDADGGAGIINIVFKNDVDTGDQLNFSGSLGYGYQEKASTSLNYAHGRKNFRFNLGYSVFHDHGKNGFEGSGTSNSPIFDAFSQTDFSTYFDYSNNAHNINLSSGYQLSSNTEIGGELTLSLAKNHSTSDVNNRRTIEGQDFFRSHLVTSGTTQKNNLISSLYVTRKFSERSNINVDIGYLTYKNDSPALTQSEYFDANDDPVVPENEVFTDGNRGTSESTIRLGVAKVDYALKMSENFETEFGVKGSYSNNTNDSKIETNYDGVWEVDPRSQSRIESEEKLWAAYGQFRLALGEKSKVNAGLRYEDWKRTLTTSEDDFVIQQFFPSFSYQYALTENQNVNFNYHRRISRPAYSDLVTSLYYNDPTAIFTGNPLLKPSIINTVQLEYVRNGFSVGLSYQKETNPIIRYQLTSTPQNDILVVSPQNADYQKSLNLFLNFPVQWAHWAKLNLSTTSAIRDYHISYNPEPRGKTYFYQSLNFTQTFQLPWEMDIEFSGWYNFDHYNGTNFTQGFGMVNFGLSKQFKKNWGTLQFSVTDLFKSLDIDTHISGMAPIVFNIDTRSRYRDESAFTRIFRITYSRSFGGNGNKSSRNLEKEEFRRVD
ncbi:TonB-dependent receptor [Muricauda sp. CAU 1633]|uniref:outer membrane beta-barrel family protein n=1 Tax=Allomuricauda sp. CAU 1633 TaxID=2816036 RepID=UPI001A8E053A|nr:outer membrane beta-barrel family protein [Muricauda sp. CAU 1633]MBO0322811.1 TonB-dependent receptor [Muricauda sp. CAU 1633]